MDAILTDFLAGIILSTDRKSVLNLDKILVNESNHYNTEINNRRKEIN